MTTVEALELLPGVTIGRLHRWAHRGLLNPNHTGTGTGVPADWTTGDVLAARFLLAAQALGLKLSAPGVIAAAHLLAGRRPSDLVGSVLVVSPVDVYLRCLNERPTIDATCVLVSLDPLLDGLAA